MWSRQEQSHYFRELIPYLVASVLLIVAGAGLGIISSTDTPKLSGARGEALGEFAKLFLELPKPYLALAIFFNNSLKTLAVIVPAGERLRSRPRRAYVDTVGRRVGGPSLHCASRRA
jgi:hypothetical protein